MLLLSYLVLTGLMGWRLVSVQVVSAAEYRDLADRQVQRTVELPPTRGKLYDRSGEPLAMSLSAATIYANPRELREGGVDPTFIAAELAPLLDSSLEELMEALTSDTGFTYLARQVPRRVGQRVEAAKLAGVGVLAEPTRVYPAPGLASQVIGFAGVDNIGLEGLELSQDELLAGTPGRLSLERAPQGLEIAHGGRELEPPVPGTDLVLTLDRQIQATTESTLTDAVDRYGALGGSAVVMDTDTGEILAMASTPGFDPSNPRAADPYDRRNRAVTDIFEPGSVNKVIAAAAAMEEGKVWPDEVFTVPDTWQVGPKEFKDSSPHETESMTFSEIIAKSSNVGTIQVAQRLEPAVFHDYLTAFGMGRATGLGFPGESRGLLRDPADWWVTDQPAMAIGQSVSSSLLQMAGVFETIASGGEWVQPSLVRGAVGADGRLRPAAEAERSRVVSTETAQTLSRMLVGVITDGTGELAAVPGYEVAGKTGTAQKPSEDGGYQEGAYIATFAGFAPADDPALVVAVMLDDPTPYYGGLTAAPVFSEIMEFALGHERVAPSDPGARLTATPAAP